MLVRRKEVECKAVRIWRAIWQHPRDAVFTLPLGHPPSSQVSKQGRRGGNSVQDSCLMQMGTQDSHNILLIGEKKECYEIKVKYNLFL